ncbi:MAG TPA: GNAT family N-acetyltransferase [Candidatus Binatia bacterium]|jgi:acetyl coenzyme A synthetase (ADP forming)-like protein
MTSVCPRYLPLPYQEAPESGRLILRDGTTASIRVSRPQDKEAIKAFFASLSNESRLDRFFSRSLPEDRFIESLCDSSDPRSRLTLVVTRLREPAEWIIAAGSYAARDGTTAEIAIAVADEFQGRGIGTILLERLAVLAARNGFARFWAVLQTHNQAMLDVFRQSGFDCHQKIDHGYVEIDLSVTPSEGSIACSEVRERVATAASLLPFFYPRSVAVVGASRNPSSIGGRILGALIANGFHGDIYPVNPNATSVASLPAYPSVRDLPQAAELAVITVPRDAVLGVIDDCAARGVRAVVVITAGFAEIGAEGRQLQQRLVEKVRGHGMRMIGPNCLGLLNTDPAVKLNASFAPDFPPSGKVAFCSQSGALGLAIIALARERDLGLSHFVSVGNKADVSGNDLLQYWEDDPHTGVVLLYLESFGNPRRFARIASRIARRKPVVAVKAGRTGAGGRAAGSHTAALASSDVAVDAMFQQTGVIRADTLDEMFDLALALSNQPLPNGRRVGILTNAGGLGILCADACETGGLEVAHLSQRTQQLLRQFLPATASVGNPVDMIASATADQFRKAVEILLASDEIDSLIVLTIHVGLADIAAIAEHVQAAVTASPAPDGKDKPVLSCFMDGGTALRSPARVGERVPNYQFPERAARVLSKIAAYAEWRSEPPGIIADFDDITPVTARSVCQARLNQRGAGWLSQEELRQVLTALGLPLPRGGVCRSADEAARTAAEIGFPVAVKLVSTEIVHKTEMGGVQLGLQNETAVRAAFDAIRNRLTCDDKLGAMDGVLVQPMITGGVEVMVGVTQDPSFGPLIAFGLGGIYVEILKDVCFRVTPITDRDASEMVRSIRGYRLLEGYRGHPPADIPAIEDLLLRVARLIEEVPEISELDLNPVFALPPGQGCVIVDARIRVALL